MTSGKLQEFLNNATVFSGTSKSIQNELIESVSHVVEEKIRVELLYCRYLFFPGKLTKRPILVVIANCL